MTIADRVWGRQTAQILPLFALMLALLILPVAALAVDGGLLLQTRSELQAEAQASAESGSQAVDVLALDRTGQFQLCTVPDGNSTCGNGVGGVTQVVDQSVSPRYLGTGCVLVDPHHLTPGRGRAHGCELALRSRCRPANGQAVGATGVTVLLWRTVAMPLLALGPWALVAVRGEATAWLAHGYGRAISAPTVTVSRC